MSRSSTAWDSVRFNKLEAARRQLDTAIKFYFAYGDEVSIHTP